MRKINTRLFLIRYLLSTQAGFSLLESLIAVVVVSILLAAIVPSILLTTAARAQARRVDLATQAARGYVDGVRAGVIDVISTPSVFPFKSSVTNRSQYFTDVPAPNSSTVGALFQIPGVAIDTNGNGFSFDDPQDLVIQPMRSGPDDADGSTVSKQGFYMGVRVYRADAFQGTLSSPSIKTGITLQKGGDDVNCPSGNRVFTSTNGSQSCPLVIMKVDVYPKEVTFTDLKNRI